MPKMIVREEDILNNASKYTPAGETQLVGVFAMRVGAVPWKTDLRNVIIAGPALATAAAAQYNKSIEVFANDTRIVIGEHGLIDAAVQQVTTYLHKDISKVKIRRGITYKVKIWLADGNKIKFRIGYFVLSHKTHKERATQVIEILSHY